MDASDKGPLLSLALDAADPRLPPEARLEALQAAAGIDMETTLGAVAGILHGVLDGLRLQFGEQAVDVIMRQVGEWAIAVVGEPS